MTAMPNGLTTAHPKTSVERLRARTLIIAVGLMVAAGLGGAAAASKVKSPADHAMQTAPPDLGVATARVELRQLGGEILASGTLLSASSVELPGPAGQGRVVTLMPTPGDTVEAGSRILELEGRPLIALAGDVPVYRDLVGGSKGRDVIALQEALGKIGLLHGPLTGEYDPETAAGVERLYRGLGYPLPEPPVVQSDLQGARDALVDAETALAVMRRQRIATLDSRADALREAERAVGDAQATLEGARAVASKRIEAAVTATSSAKAALSAARERLEDAPPEESEQAERDVRQAEIGLAETEAAEVAARTESAGTIREAEGTLALASASVDAAKQEAGDPSPDLDVAAAERSLARAAENLKVSRLGSLTPFPAAELAMVPTLPMTVAAATVDPGAVLDEPAVTLRSDSDLVAVVTAPRDVAQRLRIDDPAWIDTAGSRVGGHVSWIAVRTGPEGAERRYGDDVAVPEGQVAVEVVMEQTENALPTGSPTTVAFELFTGQDEGLVVPIGGVRTDAQGHSWVAVVTQDDSVRRVDVEVRESLDGAASVGGDGLREGAEIVVGEY